MKNTIISKEWEMDVEELEMVWEFHRWPSELFNINILEFWKQNERSTTVDWIKGLVQNFQKAVKHRKKLGKYNIVTIT